jgi:uncharacterized protein (TIGR00730 family)
MNESTKMNNIKGIAVYCSSSVHIDPKYHDGAIKLGQALAQNGIQLVYGGGRRGLMGLIADSTMAAGGNVFGVTTNHLDNYEVGHHGISELHVVTNMHQRKQMMFDHSDAFIILPGGMGTLEEFFEILTWKQIGLHAKHIVIVNSFGYWTPLKTLISHMLFEGFASRGDERLLHFVDTVEEAVPYILTAPSIKIDPTLKFTNYPTASS